MLILFFSFSPGLFCSCKCSESLRKLVCWDSKTKKKKKGAIVLLEIANFIQLNRCWGEDWYVNAPRAQSPMYLRHQGPRARPVKVMNFPHWCLPLYRMPINRPQHQRMKSPWFKSRRRSLWLSPSARGSCDMRKEVDTDVYHVRLRLPVFIRKCLIFKGGRCRGQVSISYAAFKRSWRRFYIWPLEFILKYPSSLGQISFKAHWSSHGNLLSGLFALPRCDGVDWVPPASSPLCHSLTASRWVTKLFHRGDWQSHIHVLIKFVTHPCSCPQGCHLSLIFFFFFLCF